MTNTIQFQILSDLHLETHPSYEFEFIQNAPNLALLGDIGHIEKDDLFKFLERQLTRFKLVFFLLGNHEPYHLKLPFAKQRVLRFSTKMENKRASAKVSLGRVVFLDQIRFDIDDEFTILGCTLHSRVTPEQARAIQSRLVDFRDILDWDVGDHVDAHLADLAWLNDQVTHISTTEPDRRIIIFTHHSPTIDVKANDAKYRNSEVTSGFMNDLSKEECWKNSAIVMWAFGHTRFNCDFVDEQGKRIVTNQKGYYSIPQSSFQASKTYEITDVLNDKKASR